MAFVDTNKNIHTYNILFAIYLYRFYTNTSKVIYINIL